MLFWHVARDAASRTFCTAGRSKPISTAMIAMTTSSSISVKPRRYRSMELVSSHRRPGRDRLQGSHERHQVLLLALAELQVEKDVEELDGVLERRQPAVVQVRRAVLDAAKRKGLDPPFGAAVVELLDP